MTLYMHRTKVKFSCCGVESCTTPRPELWGDGVSCEHVFHNCDNEVHVFAGWVPWMMVRRPLCRDAVAAQTWPGDIHREREPASTAEHVSEELPRSLAWASPQAAQLRDQGG